MTPPAFVLFGDGRGGRANAYGNGYVEGDGNGYGGGYGCGYGDGWGEGWGESYGGGYADRDGTPSPSLDAFRLAVMAQMLTNLQQGDRV